MIELIQTDQSPMHKEHSEEQVKSAILETIAYTDIFDYPLTEQEIHRYLTGIKISPLRIRATLTKGETLGWLAKRGEYYSLPDREITITIRQQRQEHARQLWPQATYYGAQLARLPFVRMVAVTGSLAVNNVDPHADIDFFIVSANDRLWLCRALTIVLVRLAHRKGVPLCPNYFVSERALTIQHRSLYAARELAQMIPLSGFELYRKLLASNRWMNDFLPNAQPLTMEQLPSPPPGRTLLQQSTERVLETPVGTLLECWEQQRKIRKFNAESAVDETAFSKDQCKGHFDGHRQQVMARYQHNLTLLNHK